MIRSVLVFALAALLMDASAALARNQIRVVGSSTVFPFVTAAAEEFGRSAEFRTPIVEATGTGGGLKLFCSGLGPGLPDMANASRHIKDSEVTLCRKNGVSRIVEVEIGYDGIVFVGSKQAQPLPLTKEHLFLALARQVPQNGKLVDNPYRNWREISPDLPTVPISVYGPPPTSGTRDAFVEMVMEKACAKFPEFAAALPDEKDRKAACSLVREDGVYIESGENDNLIIQKLQSNPEAIGIVGYSFLEENGHKVQASTVEGVEPTVANISEGKYGVSRSMFVYVKGDHVGLIPGIAEFIAELTSDKAFGPEGYLVDKGLIPLDGPDRARVRESVTRALKEPAEAAR